MKVPYSNPHARWIVATPSKKRPKYGNRKVVKNGEKFDSVHEYERHLVLLDMQKRGEISELQRQDRLEVWVLDTLICTYVADWSYIQNGRTVIEDAKGFQTPEFKLKWKLVQAVFPSYDFVLS
jgi:hypothetical protein